MRSICLFALLFLSSFGATINAEANPKEESPKEESPTPAPAKIIEKTAPAAQSTTSNTLNKETTPYFSDDELQQDKNGAQETHFGELLVRMLLILTVTIVALVIISWLAKRFLYSRMQDLNRASRIQILEKRTLSPKSMLYIVKIDEEELAIAEFPNGVQLLKVLSK